MTTTGIDGRALAPGQMLSTALVAGTPHIFVELSRVQIAECETLAEAHELLDFLEANGIRPTDVTFRPTGHSTIKWSI